MIIINISDDDDDVADLLCVRFYKQSLLQCQKHINAITIDQIFRGQDVKIFGSGVPHC